MNSSVRALVRQISPSLFAFLKVIWLPFNKDSFLVTSGLLHSYRMDYPCRPDGSPLPWMNYNVIALLDERLDGDMHVFEYGSGFSTLYFAERVSFVVSVENDLQWFEKLSPRLPSNVKLIYRTLEDTDQYCQSIFEVGQEYDLIVIDGRERVRCAQAACQALSPKGVILFDDTQRPEYAPGISQLIQEGFKRLDFIGFKPAGVSQDITSVLYRPGNCLDI